MVDWDKLTPVILSLAPIIIPAFLILVAFGTLLGGFAIYSLVSFVSNWMWPLLFFGVGLLLMIELLKYAEDENKQWAAVAGIFAFIVPLFAIFFYESGYLNGPTNSYNLLLSVAPGATITSSVSFILPILEAFFYGIAIIASVVAVRNGL